MRTFFYATMASAAVATAACTAPVEKTGQTHQAYNSSVNPYVTSTIVGITGKCLDSGIDGVAGMSANGTPIVLWDCWGGSDQNWTLNLATGQITNAAGKCLDAAGGSSADGTVVQLWDCWDGPNQRWTVETNVTITGIGGKCLDAVGGTSAGADGTSIQLWDCWGGPNQQWTSTFAQQESAASNGSDCGDPTWGCQGPPPPGSCGPWEGYPSCPVVACPLVVRFSPGPITFLGHGVAFDFFGDRPGALADWIGPESGLLALPDADGNVTKGAQLFGTETPLANGALAPDGFAALAQYDDNRNGVVDAQDPIFSRLVLWFDANSNGVSNPGEVVSLASRGVTRFVLADTRVHANRDAKGSYVGLESTFTWTREDGARASSGVADAYFATAAASRR